MQDASKQKPYDLEERTFLFAKEVRRFVRRIPEHACNWEDGRQLVRSSGSVGANYLEANDGISKKDFLLRIRISRKEAKESRYWLRLIDPGDSPELIQKRTDLIQEAQELMNILGAILQKSQ
ncbi:MAG: four helix bundle protein [Candidatus Sumerlaeia bacterium]